MKLGIGLFTCRQRPDDDRPHSDRYQELLTLTERADQAGLDSAWVSEHHFMEDGYLSGIVSTLSAMAATTEDITVGPYIAIPSLYDSVRLAEDAATISLFADGRLVLGLGLGHREDEFESFGAKKSERVERTVDTIEVLRNAWSEGPLGFEPEFHPIGADRSVTPKPEIDPPIILGGLAQPAVRRAARFGDGWAAGASLSLDELDRRVADIRSVRDDEELDGDFTIYATRYGFIGDSRESAWEAMREGYLFSRRVYSDWLPDQFERSSEWEREMKEQAIFGTPEEVAGEINAFADRLGDDIHFIFRLYHPGMETSRMTACIDQLATEVQPRLP